MKKQLLILFGILLLCNGCKKENLSPESLELSGTAYHFDNEIHEQFVEITSNADWKITGGTDWCAPDRVEGSGNHRMVITVRANTEQSSRKTVLTVKNNYKAVNITISQDAYWGGSVVDPDDYHYRLPIVFHVLYNDENDPNQNIEGDLLRNALEKCNELYSGSRISQDMNLEFVPATTDPGGRELQEPGVNRIAWPISIVMDANNFMKNGAYSDLMWDQDNYINVVIFTFTKNNTMGISHLPYTIGTNGLPGLNDGTYYLNRKPAYPHCLALNNKYATGMNPWVDESDFVLTLEHELGHYLGLFHVFAESNTCTDDDYCSDTPSYDRNLYDSWFQSAGRLTLEEGAQRMNCNGDKFVSDNVMDYDISYFNYFSPDQRSRIRNVLENSPLIPGPKANRSKGVLNLDDAKVPEVRWVE